MASSTRPRAGPACLLLLAIALIYVQLVVFPGLKIEAAARELPGTPASLLSALLDPPQLFAAVCLGGEAAGKADGLNAPGKLDLPNLSAYATIAAMLAEFEL